MVFSRINSVLFAVICFSMSACSFSPNGNMRSSAAQSDSSGDIDLASVPEIRDSQDFVAYLLSDAAEEQVMGLSGRNSKGDKKASSGNGNGNKDKQEKRSAPAPAPAQNPSRADAKKKDAEPPRVLAQTRKTEPSKPKAEAQAPAAKPKSQAQAPAVKPEQKAAAKPDQKQKQKNQEVNVIRVASKEEKKANAQNQPSKKQSKKPVIKRAEAAIRKQEKIAQRQLQRQSNLTMAVANLKDVRAMPSKGLYEAKAKCDAISAAIAFLKSTTQPVRPFDGMRKDFRRALKAERDEVLRENKFTSCAAATQAIASIPVPAESLADEEVVLVDAADQVEDVAVDEIVSVEDVVVEEVILEEPAADEVVAEVPMIDAPVNDQPQIDESGTVNEADIINRL